MSERQVPFYCPYCGEETLRPAGSRRRASGSAGRAPAGFQLRFVAVCGRRAATR